MSTPTFVGFIGLDGRRLDRFAVEIGPVFVFRPFRVSSEFISHFYIFYLLALMSLPASIGLERSRDCDFFASAALF